MKARRAAAVARRVLQQLRRDRRTLVLIFAAPLVILTILWALMRHSDTSASAPRVAVVNQDAGGLGTSLTDLLRLNAGASLESSPGAAEARLRAGDLDAYIVLPPGFSAAANSQHRFDETVRVEGGQPGTEAIVSRELQAALAQVFLAQLPFAGAVPADHPDVSYLHGKAGLDQLDYLGAAFIGVVVYFLVFVVTSVVFLRERTGGTLERLMASPISRADLVVGYSIALGVVTLVLCAVVMTFTLAVLHVYNEGNVGLVFLFAGLIGLGAANLGIFLSLFARSEFQAVQFIPLVIAPQILLAGLLFPVDSEPPVLRAISNVLPLTYGIKGLRDVMIRGAGAASGEVSRDLLILAAFALLAVVAGAASLRRRVA